jgi:microcystin-dependent protein
MASPPTVSNLFLPSTVAESGQVNENFADLISWISSNTMQRDGSVAFTGIPLLPSTMPSNANHAARKGYVDAAVENVAGVVFPVGSVIDYAGASAPEGWALLNGQTLTNAESLFPQLWAVVPTAWRSGSNVVLPNAGGRVVAGRDSSDSMFQNIGQTGGARNAIVVAHAHGSATISGTTNNNSSLSMSGTANISGNTSNNNLHAHNSLSYPLEDSPGTFAAGTNRRGRVIGSLTSETSFASAHTHSFAATATVNSTGGIHSHGFSGTVAIPSEGESGVDKNFQPYLVMTKIIKLG